MSQSPDQQTAMIRGMVDGLAARLKQDGSDLDGWVRLIRSYKVLGESDKAQAAVSDAQQALQNDPEKRKRLDAALEGTECKLLGGRSADEIIQLASRAGTAAT